MSKLLNVVGWLADKMNLCRLYFRKNRYLKYLHIGQNSLISGETDFGFPNNIYIGDNSYINGGGGICCFKKCVHNNWGQLSYILQCFYENGFA